MAAGEGPVKSGSVTPGTVEETVRAQLLDTPDLQRLLRRSPGGPGPVGGPAGDHVANRSIYNTDSMPGEKSVQVARVITPGPPTALHGRHAGRY